MHKELWLVSRLRMNESISTRTSNKDDGRREKVMRMFPSERRVGKSIAFFCYIFIICSESVTNIPKGTGNFSTCSVLKKFSKESFKIH